MLTFAGGLTGCSPAHEQMRAAHADKRCATSARIGKEWLERELPRKRRAARGDLTKTNRVGKEHAKVVVRMLDALACLAVEQNSIAALRSYRKIAGRLVGDIDPNHRKPAQAAQKRNDAYTIGAEATVHYFKVAVPQGTLKAFREHRVRYPRSRYRDKALKREVDLAGAEAEDRPSYKKAAAFARTYGKLPYAHDAIWSLWKRTAKAELARLTAKQSPDVAGLVLFVRRYGRYATDETLLRAESALRTAVDAEVAELRRTGSVKGLLHFIDVTRKPGFAPRFADLTGWLGLRHALVKRDLMHRMWERSLNKGTRDAYEAFISYWGKDSAAADSCKQMQAALDGHRAWAGLGPAPSNAVIGRFLDSRGDDLKSDAAEKLSGCPSVPHAFDEAIRINGADRDGLGQLLTKCQEATWCDLRRASIREAMARLARAAKGKKARKKRRKRKRRKRKRRKRKRRRR